MAREHFRDVVQVSFPKRIRTPLTWAAARQLGTGSGSNTLTAETKG